jgi:hypothetical protein
MMWYLNPMPLKDPEARRAYHRDYMRRRYNEDAEFRKSHRKRASKNDLRYLQRNRQIVDDWKRERGCLMRWEPEMCCFIAHHRDPATKEFCIAEAVVRRVSEKRLRAELAKCECLCSNCHTKVHAGIERIEDYI